MGYFLTKQMYFANSKTKKESSRKAFSCTLAPRLEGVSREFIHVCLNWDLFPSEYLSVMTWTILIRVPLGHSSTSRILFGHGMDTSPSGSRMHWVVSDVIQWCELVGLSLRYGDEDETIQLPPRDLCVTWSDGGKDETSLDM